ncbi:hypothetical protein HYPSUDRAFT_171019 [Hypholoma sublateritium FD-334 SS-4]|uniref:Uncharacterized protein n=1 Tax=Hypholoma sublateritium (strain FD-334 SS-4) TaxID=945553 RepID=A0A0D2P903_HYPSF|nr:hypothetical protein HYPSUDRAFT_171019 [Hypholoma sublateritium FD-334 SS-4]
MADLGVDPELGHVLPPTTTELNSQADVHIDVGRTATATPSINANDPFGIRDGLISDTELVGLRKRRKGKAIGKYQSRQNDLISAFLKPIEEHSEDAKAEEEAARLPVKIAIYASLLCNCALAILQIYAAVSSVSLSLLATGIDSVFDVGSNIWLFFIHRQAERLDGERWPVGGARLETIGNIVYGSLMGSVNLVIVVEAARTLLTKKGDALAPFHLPSIVAVGIALGVKLLLFIYCYSIRNKSSQVRVLWQDHRNDLWINGFGIVMSILGSKLTWWLDPTGAVMISLGVIASWGRTIYKEFALLAGKSASHDFLQLIIYKVATFSDVIDKVDTVRAYHSGPNYFVEVDIVMDADTPLHVSHDVSELLQNKLEALPHVERAFVHVDYEWEHIPEHRQRKSTSS